MDAGSSQSLGPSRSVNVHTEWPEPFSLLQTDPDVGESQKHPHCPERMALSLSPDWLGKRDDSQEATVQGW